MLSPPSLSPATSTQVSPSNRGESTFECCTCNIEILTRLLPLPPPPILVRPKPLAARFPPSLGAVVARLSGRDNSPAAARPAAADLFPPPAARLHARPTSSQKVSSPPPPPWEPPAARRVEPSITGK